MLICVTLMRLKKRCKKYNTNDADDVQAHESGVITLVKMLRLCKFIAKPNQLMVVGNGFFYLPIYTKSPFIEPGYLPSKLRYLTRSKLLIATMMQSHSLSNIALYHIRPWHLPSFSSELVSRKLSTGKSASRQLLAVAPMMGHTDFHQRYLQRLISKKTVLYTEMVVAAALLRSGVSEPRMRAHFEIENPVVLQLGGNDAAEMKLAAKLAVSYGYQEINLNIGCPSEKVAGESGFGAALYLNPPLVAELALAVYEATHKPATIKCRIGVNNHESYEELYNFIRLVSEIGKVEHFIVHARIAILDPEFSPKNNRNIPPLKYDVVYRLIQDFLHLKFTLNGGIPNMKTAQELLKEHPQLEGVMVGRAIMSNPFGWSRADSLLFKTKDPGAYNYYVILFGNVL